MHFFETYYILEQFFFVYLSHRSFPFFFPTFLSNFGCAYMECSLLRIYQIFSTFKCCWFRFASILLMIFVLIFLRDISLDFPFLEMSFRFWHQFHIGFERVNWDIMLFFSTLWKRLRKIGVNLFIVFERIPLYIIFIEVTGVISVNKNI